jgi:hypothetical protein
LNNNARDWIKEWKTFIRNFKRRVLLHSANSTHVIIEDVYDGMKGNNSSSWNEG